MPKILGLYHIRSNEWQKLIYVHSNAGGQACVNGKPAQIALHRAGDPMPADGDYLVVVPKETPFPKERYMAFNAGESLLWIDDDISPINAGFIEISATFEFWRKIRAGVLTVSDKGATGDRLDTAGPALCDLLEAAGASVLRRQILPDERTLLAETLKKWADEDRLQLILTTGGTGLAKRDTTPEALLDIHDRIVPGFGEIMRSHSTLYTKRGFLTRSLAVTRGETLVIAFPGSERAVRQCFEAIAPFLRHGVEILSGWDAECGEHRHA